MSELKVIIGSLKECQEEINELEKSHYVVVASARVIVEQEAQLGSGTGWRPPKVMTWEMLLQHFPMEEHKVDLSQYEPKRY